MAGTSTRPCSFFIHFLFFVNKLSLGWLGLALVFVFLPLDEATQIHEFFIGYFRNDFGLSGYFYSAWIIPYGVALVVLALVYIPFFNRLDRSMFLSMAVSGAVFLSGAIGMEMFGGYTMDNEGFGLGYMLFYTMEETLEKRGVSLFYMEPSPFSFPEKKESIAEISTNRRLNGCIYPGEQDSAGYFIRQIGYL
ncbi:hypothetical protein SAMN05192553_103175 [Cyclobacterium xiamenense]|uniref:Uncharacterized protein n=1 Tax=Cyclobacterium xiamenense TaxID=1297121 RepID=A0A1H6Y1R4_9BACT|nr:hypothetical protein [Cyclobacterium xiamenense]SEJ31060.1 hypothetical protein SAMN05192553_103175 [Cyclobacterium xiamenense]